MTSFTGSDVINRRPTGKVSHTMFLRKMTQRSATGFSILELLIALIIIGILALILIPLVSNRAKQARIRAAESDLERIATAQDMAAVDTGYFVRLFMLNDRPGFDQDGEFQRPTGSATVSGDQYDATGQYQIAGYFQNLDELFLEIVYPRVGVPAPNGNDLRQRLTDNETRFNWNGPYVNWSEDENFYNDPVFNDGAARPDGIPDDPWGNNYLLFVPDGQTVRGVSVQGGLLLEPDGTVVQSADFPLGSASPLVTGIDCNVFDRVTLLSLGPNGLPGDGTGNATPEAQIGADDDIVRQFGP